MLIKPGDERFYNEEHYICSFCGKQVDRGAIWIGPDISVCNRCVLSDHAADIIGRIFGDALFAVYGTRAYTAEVERITKQIEASTYRILYNHARSTTKRAGEVA